MVVGSGLLAACIAHLLVEVGHRGSGPLASTVRSASAAIYARFR